MTSAPAWREAAHRLARRVERRERAGAVFPFAAAGLAAGAVGALAAAAFGDAGPTGTRAVTVFLGLAGVGVGLARAARTRRVDPGDAAWALDRLASARERGLAAAVLSGGVAAEAAGDARLPAPPRVRLSAPRGTAALASAGLLAAIAWTWLGASRGPGPGDAPAEASSEAAAGTGAGAGDAARRAEARAESLARRARAVAAAREAVGLPPGAALDPERVAGRLSSPEAREAARRAAPELASALEAQGADGADPAGAWARALAGDPASEAEALRREAAALRASSGVSVPASRRATVAEYFARRAGAPR